MKILNVLHSSFHRKETLSQLINEEMQWNVLFSNEIQCNAMHFLEYFPAAQRRGIISAPLTICGFNHFP